MADTNEPYESKGTSCTLP